MKTILNNRGGIDNYFTIEKTNSDGYDIEDILQKINHEAYWIYKYSNKQKQVSIEEMKEFEYAGYIFFHKSKYNPDYINHWITHINRLMHTYMVKPLPPFPPTKIIVRK
jgi:hypothetical protein